MKKIALFGILTFIAMFVFGQNSVSVYFAQTYSKFKFIDSDGIQDESLNFDINYSYGVNYSKVFKAGLLLRPELCYKNFGAISSVNNEKLEWSLNYLDVNFGIGYIYKKQKIQPYVGISPYFAYLYKADQTIGNTYFDMLENKSILTFDFGLNEFLGVKYVISEMVALFFEMRNSTGLHQLEPNIGISENQELYNRAMSIGFGLNFIINNYKTPRIWKSSF